MVMSAYFLGVYMGFLQNRLLIALLFSSIVPVQAQNTFSKMRSSITRSAQCSADWVHRQIESVAFPRRMRLRIVKTLQLFAQPTKREQVVLRKYVQGQPLNDSEIKAWKQYRNCALSRRGAVASMTAGVITMLSLMGAAAHSLVVRGEDQAALPEENLGDGVRGDDQAALPEEDLGKGSALGGGEEEVSEDVAVSGDKPDVEALRVALAAAEKATNEAEEARNRVGLRVRGYGHGNNDLQLQNMAKEEYEKLNSQFRAAQWRELNTRFALEKVEGKS